MKVKESNVQKKPISTIILYAASAFIAIIGIVLLINNIRLFINTVNQYAAQGYPRADVVKQLVPSQLIPGVLQPIAVYWGIALILYGVGMVNQNVLKCIVYLQGNENCCNCNGQEEAMQEVRGEDADSNDSEIIEENK